MNRMTNSTLANLDTIMEALYTIVLHMVGNFVNNFESPLEDSAVGNKQHYTQYQWNG